MVPHLLRTLPGHAGAETGEGTEVVTWVPGPLWGARLRPPNGRPKCGAGGGMLCPPAPRPLTGPEASAPPLGGARAGAGGRRRRVPSLEVFFPSAASIPKYSDSALTAVGICGRGRDGSWYQCGAVARCSAGGIHMPYLALRAFKDLKYYSRPSAFRLSIDQD